ncbi:hypothetical protein BDA99DRAFT_465447 [Phascolomyces articulosus]|uniref:ferroxidase n=1 Tax=Phascolomyces articulosus TaxID=60185 RepID=A0AAD5PCP7_9FUNG|nr:hypothetical protein BDA99DRAFT_465447 [Phascolomyces articulosus]
MSLTRCLRPVYSKRLISQQAVRSLATAAVAPKRVLTCPMSNSKNNMLRVFLTRRNLFTASAVQQSYNAASLTIDQYHQVSDDTLDHIDETLETIGEEVDLPGFDIEYSQGVMTIKLGEHGTYVLNKQPPNQQIWLSSPKSGPKRYDYDTEHKKWFYHRDNHTLDELLNEELSQVFGQTVDVMDGFEP